jgi:hypothetical protein
MKKLIAYEIYMTWCHVEARLGHDGPGYKCEGQAKGLGAMDRRDGGETRAKGLASMGRDNREK